MVSCSCPDQHLLSFKHWDRCFLCLSLKLLSALRPRKKGHQFRKLPCPLFLHSVHAIPSCGSAGTSFGFGPRSQCCCLSTPSERHPWRLVWPSWSMMLAELLPSERASLETTPPRAWPAQRGMPLLDRPFCLGLSHVAPGPLCPGYTHFCLQDVGCRFIAFSFK